MTQHSHNLVVNFSAINDMIRPCFLQRIFMTIWFLFLILLNVTKYSRLVRWSPNLQCHVYIAAHVR